MDRRRNTADKIYREMTLKGITNKALRMRLKEDVRILAKVSENNGHMQRAGELYFEAATGRYRSDTLSFLGKFSMDNDDGALACAYLEMAYDMGDRNIRLGDYLMMGSYRQFDVKEGIEYGLNRDMKLALKWYLEMLKQDTFAYGNLSYAYMEREVRDYQKAYRCAMLCPDNNVRGIYCAGLIHEFGLAGEPDGEKAEKYYRKVLDLEPEGELFYDRSLERLAEIKGIVRIPFTVKFFETMMDECLL